MNSSSPPPAPNAQATVQQQTAANKDTAITQQNLNSVNQVTPWGNLSYSQSGTWADGTPKYTATTTLSPEQQGLFDLYQKTQGNLGQAGVTQSQNALNTLSNPFDLNSATSTQQSDIQRRLLDPVWQARDEQQATRLRNQGIVPGTEAYTNAMRDYGMQRDNSYDQNLLNSRSQAVSEALAQRNQPLNELSAILSGTGVSSPQFTNTPQTGVANTDVGGIVNNGYQNQLQAYNASNATKNAMLGGLFGLGGTALGGWGMGGFKGFGR